MQICREPRHQGDPRARIQAGSRLLRWALVEAIQHQPAGTRSRAAREAILARRGKEARGIAKTAAARVLLTKCFASCATSTSAAPYAAAGPEPGTWKDPDPRRRSSRGIRGLRIGLRARQWRLRDACGLSRLNDFLALWSQAHLPSCNRQVVSTSVHMVEPGPASAPGGHAPL